MSNGIVLNHHSLPFSGMDDADNGLLVFLRLIKECRGFGLKILLVDEGQDKSLMGLELARNYFVRDWYNTSKNVPSRADWVRFLRSIETKQPLFEAVDLEKIGENMEVGLPDESSGEPILLAAVYFDTFLASFSAVPKWLESHIDVWVLDLTQTPNEREGVVLNISGKDSQKIHVERFQQFRNDLLKNSKDIWEHRLELFPSITLLDKQIGTALKTWSARPDILFKAREALHVMEVFCNKWSSGEYDDYQHQYLKDLGLSTEVTGESSSVKSDPKKKNERMFWLEDGRQVYCENHVKLPEYYRMHFFPDSTEKRIYVAYLGPHLIL